MLTFMWLNRAIGLMSRMFANRSGDRGSIPGRVIPKTQKMVLGVTLLNTQHYMVSIKGKVEAILGMEEGPPLHLGVVAIEKGAFGLPSTTVANFTLLHEVILTVICAVNGVWSVAAAPGYCLFKVIL